MVKYDKLIEILKSTGIDERYVKIITELYRNQTAEVRVKHSVSESASIKKGIPQGCMLSPLLLNIYFS